MSKPTNPTLIGSFVLGAVVLLVAAVLLFGGEAWFAPKRDLVAYFPSSAQGLRQGSNVMLNGVRIGSVTNVRVLGELTEQQSMNILVEVTMRVLPSSFELVSNGVIMSTERRVKTLTPEQYINAGMRAKLATESFVTGQLFVELDFRPDLPAVFRAPIKGGLQEIPTIPSDVAQVLERVQSFLTAMSNQVDVEKLARDVQGILSGANEIANSQDLRDMLAGGSRLANGDLPRLTTALERTLGDVQGSLKDVRALVTHADGEIDPLMADLKPAVQRLDETLKAAQQTLQAVSGHVREDSALSLEVRHTLQDVQSMSDAATALLQYLNEHPEALLRGKRK